MTKLKILAVTGSNGKTTTSYLLYQALKKLNNKSGYIGTLGYGFQEPFTASGYTTPPQNKLSQIIEEMESHEVGFISLEASSHALDQGRLNYIAVDTAAFTNISPEHLNYHKTMKAYQQAKLKLFTEFSLKNVVVNVGDPFGLQIMEKVKATTDCLTVAVINHGQAMDADILGDIIRTDLSGMAIRVKYKNSESMLHSQLLGYFNAENVLVALGVLLQQGFSLKAGIDALTDASAPCGRMQLVAQVNCPKIIIDYAHTPDALLKLLQAIRQFDAEVKIFLVFGCGGGGDKAKRMMMGQVAGDYANHCIVTNDNPRDEQPEKIVAEIQAGFSKHVSFDIILDRQQAIQSAVEQASQKDIIVIAGKGHESTQLISGVHHDFSDVDIARVALNK